MPRTIDGRYLPWIAALTVLMVVACAPAAPVVPTPSAAPSGTAAASTPTTTPTAGAATTAPASVAPTAATTAPASHVGNTATVNLVFTGLFSFSAVGMGGRCPSPYSSNGLPALFAFEGTDADFPGMGQSYSMVQFNRESDYVDVKWVLDGSTAFGLPGPATPNATLGTVKLSTDLRSVDIDTDLAQLSAHPQHEHVTGTIACPRP